ncbi:MAG: hypothetical protein NT090_13900 [Acidobacteria bacterium]|nr:hypothetical protein [Acidobacteriota bacterium]
MSILKRFRAGLPLLGGVAALTLLLAASAAFAADERAERKKKANTPQAEPAHDSAPAAAPAKSATPNRRADAPAERPAARQGNRRESSAPATGTQPAPQVRHERTQTPAAAPRARTSDDRRPVATPNDRRPVATPNDRHPVATPDDRRPVATPNDRRATPDVVHNPQGRTPDSRVRPNSPGPPAMRPVHPDRVTVDPRSRVQTYRGPNGTEAIRRPDGHVSVVRTRDMTIIRNSGGGRRVVAERPGGRVIVANSSGHGYVQRPFVVRNQTFVQRTYYVNNVAHVRVYRQYVYRGVTLHVYAPVRYYSPTFYGWAYSPWSRPISYRWEWAGSPWSGYYGGYFTPYPMYSSPALWLTDFMLAAVLEAGYRERMAAQTNVAVYAPPPGSQVPLSPAVKQAISIEVQRQLESERAMAQNPQYGQAAANGLPPGFADNRPHVFVVSRGLDVPDLTAGGRECMITEGDVLQLNGPPPLDSDTATAVVLASKGMDCRTGSSVAVSIQDLVEMQNNMRETLDRGLEDLRTRQGQGGLPALPAMASSAPVQADFASAVPPPDPNAASEIQQQAQQAGQAEQEVVNQAWAPESGQAPAPGAGSASAPATIALGQTMDEVSNILGPPARIVDLGPKKMYFYKDMKVTFTDGRVSDVQ